MARRILIPVLLLVASFLLHGLRSPKVVPAQSHSPSDPAAITLYQQPPAKNYEVLGKVEVTENLKWQDNGDVTPVVEELKSKGGAARGQRPAAHDRPRRRAGRALVGGNYQGKLYQFPFRDLPQRTAYARAIYVHPKK